jgi:outer membrane protein assembly factor BamB
MDARIAGRHADRPVNGSARVVVLQGDGPEPMSMRNSRNLAALLGAILLAGTTSLGGTAGASATAVISVDPGIGPPTSSVTVTGTDFGPSELVDIRFDSTPVGRSQSDPSGAFATAIRVPAITIPGIHTIGARGRTSHALAFASFLVRTDWTDYKFDAANTGFNPLENVLNTSNVGDLQLAWSTSTGQQIFSAVAVANGFVYVGSTDNHLYAMDTESGVVVWSFRTGGDVDDLAAGDGRVYAVSHDFNLYAVDAFSGALVWEVPYGTLFEEPVDVDGVVYVGQDAFDAATGSLLWESTAPLQTSASVVGGVVYEGGSTGFVGNVYALDAATGNVIWTAATGATTAPSAPAVAGGVVYAQAGSQLYAFEAESGAKLWQAAIGGQAFSNSPAVGGGIVYTRAAGAVIRAFDAASGRVLWSVTLGGGNSFSSAPALANGVLYTASNQNTFYALDPATGSVLFTFGAHAGIDSPAVADGRVYFGSQDDAVYALGL